MPHPASGYRNSKGERVPSVTTILSRFRSSGALIHWANQLAYEPYRQLRSAVEKIVEIGAVSPGILDDCKQILAKPADFCDYRTARDTAAGIGTLVHARVDAYIRKQEVAITDTQLKESQSGFDAFLQWAGSTQFELAEGEMQLVSDRHGYGGTPDVILVRGERVVGDWKSGDLYPEQVVPQLAAYRELLIENGRDIGRGAHAISINKKTGGFVHRYFTPAEVERGWEAFQLMLRLYGLVKEIK